MTPSVWDQLFGLTQTCFVCGRPEQEKTDWRFSNGDTMVVVCASCHADYVGLHNEPIHETMQRARCGPLQIIKRRSVH